MKKFASFNTLEQFWHVYNHLVRPNDLGRTTDYHIFKDGIKPTWEDPANEKGGKWMIRLKKGLASRYWEDVILAIIGEQFDVGQEICGAVVSVRTSEDIISIWNKSSDNSEASNKIRDQMRRVLKLPAFIAIEYKKHQDSLVDRSSFRNPTFVFRPPGMGGHDRGKGEGQHGSRYHNKDTGAGGDKKEGGSRFSNFNSSTSGGGGEGRSWGRSGGGGGGGGGAPGASDKAATSWRSSRGGEAASNTGRDSSKEAAPAPEPAPQPRRIENPWGKKT